MLYILISSLFLNIGLDEFCEISRIDSYGQQEYYYNYEIFSAIDIENDTLKVVINMGDSKTNLSFYDVYYKYLNNEGEFDGSFLRKGLPSGYYYQFSVYYKNSELLRSTPFYVN